MSNDFGPEQSPRVVLLTNRQSRRTRSYLDAARARGWPEPLVVDWTEWLDRRISLMDVLRPADWFRVESPGESWEIERRLLALEIEPLTEERGSPIARGELAACSGGRGEIHRPRQWYMGLCASMTRLAAEIGAVRCFMAPRLIPILFDKGAYQPLFQQAGLRVPEYRLNLLGDNEIRVGFGNCHRRLMLKLRHGFSAMGAVALEWLGTRVRAITTTERVATPHDDRLFLSKKVQRLLRESEIAALRRELPEEISLWVNAQRGRRRQYTHDELEFVQTIDPLFEVNLHAHRTRGEPCLTGETSFTVNGAGNMRRCHFVDQLIDSIHDDDDWSAVLKSRPCPNAHCDCHIGYVHVPSLNLAGNFGDGLLERRLVHPIER